MNIQLSPYLPSGEEEQKFLQKYDPSKYPKPSFAADGALFAVDFLQQNVKLLLIRRGGFPYRGCYALPGGFVNVDEDLDTAVQREMEEETGIAGIPFMQYHTWGAVNRDPRDRVITTSFVSLTSMDKVCARAGDDAAETEWMTVEKYLVNEEQEGSKVDTVKSILLAGKEKLEPQVRESIWREDGMVKQQAQIIQTGGLAFDHAYSVILAYEAMLKQLREGVIAINVLKQTQGTETIKRVYEVFFGNQAQDVIMANCALKKFL